MAIDIQFGTGAIHAIWRVRGRLDKEEYVEGIMAAEALIRGAGKIRILALLDGFEGWGDGGWDDERITRYTMEHDGNVERVAVVGPPEWEEQVLAFTGYPFTAKEVRYFPPSGEEDARSWLTE